MLSALLNEPKIKDKIFKKKSCIRETPNPLTKADITTNFFFEKKREKKINPDRLLVFKALRVGPQMHQSTSPTLCSPNL